MEATNESTSLDTHVYKHASLGQLRGVVHAKYPTVQFRGIPYAHIARRWSDPVVSDFTTQTDTFDATKHGPICPQKDGGLQFDFGLYGDVTLPCSSLESSELDCLNAIVTLPKLPQPTDKLPVVVL